jgi:thiosulfate/3-mercaptopyruvate sulfurtransferase
MISSPLVSASQAAPLLGKAVFLDARAGADAMRRYESGHVRGAFHAGLERDLSEIGDPALGGRHPLPSLRRWRMQLGRWGIDPSTTVVIYDDAGGAMAAARAWWMLRAVGHESVAVVDGGLAALEAAGLSFETGVSPDRAGAPYPSDVHGWPSVDAELVDALRRDPTSRLLDARAPDRFSGDSEPIDPVGGHISGAVNLPWESQLDQHGRFLALEDLRARYEKLLGTIPSQRVVCYCGSGVTACHLLLAMEACGLVGARLYVGSWSEWCRTREDATASE